MKYQAHGIPLKLTEAQQHECPACGLQIRFASGCPNPDQGMPAEVPPDTTTLIVCARCESVVVKPPNGEPMTLSREEEAEALPPGVRQQIEAIRKMVQLHKLLGGPV